jgi:hypothetical protein
MIISRLKHDLSFSMDNGFFLRRQNWRLYDLKSEEEERTIIKD